MQIINYPLKHLMIDYVNYINCIIFSTRYQYGTNKELFIIIKKVKQAFHSYDSMRNIRYPTPTRV